jgi:hypothetical protein
MAAGADIKRQQRRTRYRLLRPAKLYKTQLGVLEHYKRQGRRRAERRPRPSSVLCMPNGYWGEGGPCQQETPLPMKANPKIPSKAILDREGCPNAYSSLFSLKRMCRHCCTLKQKLPSCWTSNEKQSIVEDAVLVSGFSRPVFDLRVSGICNSSTCWN